MFPKKYKALNKNKFNDGVYSIEPIRYEDRFLIMQWRNDQIYHLRQNKPLTIEDQNNYFENVIAKLFVQEKPNQLLFSFLKYDTCIGYGGLVHINWVDKNAEISFIMDTALEAIRFHKIWSNYLTLIEEVAFHELVFHKIYTYAFDLRPHLYEVFLNAGFDEEARLKDHILYLDTFVDVIIHAKINIVKYGYSIKKALS